MGKSYKEKKARAKKAAKNVEADTLNAAVPEQAQEPVNSVYADAPEQAPTPAEEGYPDYPIYGNTSSIYVDDYPYQPVTGTYDACDASASPRRISWLEKQWDVFTTWLDRALPKLVWKGDAVIVETRLDIFGYDDHFFIKKVR